MLVIQARLSAVDLGQDAYLQISTRYSSIISDCIVAMLFGMHDYQEEL